MILSGPTIRALGIVTPHVARTEIETAGGRRLTYGESFAGYDIRIRETVTLPKGRTVLASTIEDFDLPRDVLGRVYNKSSLARRGINAFTTVLEPGWRGFLTIELTYWPLVCASESVAIEAGWPIAQVVFEMVDQMTEGYGQNKYQDQPPCPVEAL